jgi:hypothetical protein
MKSRIVITAALAFLSLQPARASAADVFAWSNHTAPFDFRFGNEIDGHQQTTLRPNGELAGLLYVHFTGVTTRDGYRVATHDDCNLVSCSPGWTLFGKPRSATFLYHEMDDHPVFLVKRSDIPQPGTFVHFHATGPSEHASGPGFLLALFAVDRFCFIHHDGAGARAAATCAENGGAPVSPGIDVATHSNIVSSYPSE